MATEALLQGCGWLNEIGGHFEPDEAPLTLVHLVPHAIVLYTDCTRARPVKPCSQEAATERHQ